MKVNNQPDIQPAQRLDSVQEYYFSRKGKEVARMNAEGKDIISLAIGSPDMPPSQQTIDTLCREAQNPNAHGYQPTVGIPQLREAMADFYKRWYEVDLDPQSEIQPLIGSKEGILHVTLAFVNPGDKVLVPNPGYPTYTSLSRLLGAEVVNYKIGRASKQGNHTLSTCLFWPSVFVTRQDPDHQSRPYPLKLHPCGEAHTGYFRFTCTA